MSEQITGTVVIGTDTKRVDVQNKQCLYTVHMYTEPQFYTVQMDKFRIYNLFVVFNE